MNFGFITRAIGAGRLALKANAPTIMVVGGVSSMTAGAVLACRQTLHIEEVMAEHIPDLEKIEKGRTLGLASYGEEVARQDRVKVYTRVAIDLTKLYAVPGVFFFGGIALVGAGHRVMLKRNASLAIAYTGLQKLFEKYRSNVVNEFGPEVDQAMYNGYKVEEFVDEKTGKVTTANVRDWDKAGNDPYNRVFEQGATSQWQNDLSVNKMFLHQQQRFAQERLNMRGYLYLSDVYEALGFPESDISRQVGWKVKKNPDGSKDFPVVDFGLDKPLPDDWKYNREKAVYLDFNCQGLIVGGKVQKILEQA